MRWRDREASKNVRSSRGRSGRGPAGFPGGIPFPLLALLGRGKGFGVIILVAILIFMSQGGLSGIGGADEDNYISEQKTPGYEQRQAATEDESDPQTEAEMQQFLAVSLKDSEDAWTEIFKKNNRQYEPTTLHTFSNYIQSACGGASKQVGPFYCSLDRTVYIDMSFYRELKHRFGASGDFTMSYVLSHEVGHHVQNELGILTEAHKMMKKLSREEANEISVRLELQADYFAGVVAKWQDEHGYLTDGDIHEAITAAQAIGDDTIQKRSQGYVVPENFTHGRAEQRIKWYLRGFQYGDLEHGDTFSLPYEKLQHRLGGYANEARL